MDIKLKSILLWLSAAIAVSANAEEPQPPAPSEPDGIIGGHEYVDLGLPSGTLWATYNIGATTPYEGGFFFAWGEVEPRIDFSWENYKFFIEHHYDPENGAWAELQNTNEDICGTVYDAARHQWGNGWRLPNEQERYELRMLCWNNGLSEENGVRGIRIYGPNEHSIFLPVSSGCLWNGEPDPFDGEESAYWTGIAEPENGFNGLPIEPSNRAKVIYVQYGGLQSESSRKAYGSNIRAVVNPKEAGVNAIAYDKNSIAISFQNGNIIIRGTDKECRLDLVDLSGRKTFSASVENGVCPLSFLSSGIYLVTVTDGITSKTQKITIK